MSNHKQFHLLKQLRETQIHLPCVDEQHLDFDINAGGLEFNRCVFRKFVSLHNSVLVSCQFEGPVNFRNIRAWGCEFKGGAEIVQSEITNSEFQTTQTVAVYQSFVYGNRFVDTASFFRLCHFTDVDEELLGLKRIWNGFEEQKCFVNPIPFNANYWTPIKLEENCIKVQTSSSVKSVERHDLWRMQ